VQEALNNALKHAQASEIIVTVEIEPQGELQNAVQKPADDPHSRPRALRVEIRDNGNGIPADYVAGIGLHSMRERAEELGGSYTIMSSPEGTQVVANLPLAYLDSSS
jgi:signal transduction histidine kinase